MALNDPSIIMSSESDTAVNGADYVSATNAQTITNNDLDKFFQDIKNRTNTSEDKQDDVMPELLDEKDTFNFPFYDANYKMNSETTSKEFFYSINEMIEIKSTLPREYFESVALTLPKKKFWRLTGKFGDNNNSNNNPNGKGSSNRNNGNRNSTTGSNNRPLSGESRNFVRRNSKTKIRGMNGGKKNAKYNKNDRYVDENDVNVNNNDLMELEGGFQPTGNSMADFEAWKANMKEMENRKKGIIPEATSNSAELKSISQNDSSSISDFLKINSNIQDNAFAYTTSTDNIGQPSVNRDSSIASSDSQEGLTGGSSRFSSFFTASPSSTSLPEKREVSESLNRSGTTGVAVSASNIAGGSRMMSFFQSNSRPGTPSTSENAKLNMDPNQKQFDQQHQMQQSQQRHAQQQQNQQNNQQQQLHIHRQQQQKQFQQTQNQQQHYQNQQSHQLQQRQGVAPPHLVQHPPHQMPPQQVLGQNPMANSSFFQGLLNKGKDHEQGLHIPPPGLSLPMSGNGVQQQRPPMGLNQGFAMGIPLPHMMPPPGYSGVPAQGNASDKLKNNRGEMAANLQGKSHPQQRMLPQQFIQGTVPPGFPLMQGFPPNFDPKMGFPSNIMGQPNGQNFYPTMPPPQNGENMSGFPTQNGFPGNGKRN